MRGFLAAWNAQKGPAAPRGPAVTWCWVIAVTALCNASAATGDELAQARAYRDQLSEVRRRVGPNFRCAVQPPFIVVSDQSQQDFERCLSHTIGWAVGLLKKDFFPNDPAGVPVIYLFDGRRSYLEHARAFFGEVPDTPFGYYSSTHNALVMNIATGGGTLVHELVHPFMDANFPRCPAWFNEGLGSLFEACREQDGHIVGLLNWRLPILQEGIRSGRAKPLRRLLAMTPDEFYRDASGLHYAQARYLLYYLQEHGRLRLFYHKLRRNTSSDPMGTRTLTDVMGCATLEQLEQTWLRFVRDLPGERVPGG